MKKNREVNRKYREFEFGIQISYFDFYFMPLALVENTKQSEKCPWVVLYNVDILFYS